MSDTVLNKILHPALRFSHYADVFTKSVTLSFPTQTFALFRIFQCNVQSKICQVTSIL